MPIRSGYTTVFGISIYAGWGGRLIDHPSGSSVGLAVQQGAFCVYLGALHFIIDRGPSACVA